MRHALLEMRNTNTATQRDICALYTFLYCRLSPVAPLTGVVALRLLPPFKEYARDIADFVRTAPRDVVQEDLQRMWGMLGHNLADAVAPLSAAELVEEYFTFFVESGSGDAFLCKRGPFMDDLLRSGARATEIGEADLFEQFDMDTIAVLNMQRSVRVDKSTDTKAYRAFAPYLTLHVRGEKI